MENQLNKEKMGKVLHRWDHNGKPWVKIIESCPRCGGTGRFSFCQSHGTVCFKCEGNGIVVEDRRSLSEKEIAARARAKDNRKAKKLNEQMELESRQEELMQLQREKHADYLAGHFYFIIGINTYKIKEEIKEAGGKYNQLLGWHFDHMIDQWPIKRVKVSEIYVVDHMGNFIERPGAHEAVRMAEEVE